jgi:phospholipid/cholesterol/gamma-HCH transport system substrate-binding protein
MTDEDKTGPDPRQKRRTRNGLLIIAGLVGMAMLVFFLADIFDAFKRRYQIIGILPDAPGIGIGTPVSVSGRTVGTVKRIAILPTTEDALGRVTVTLDLPRHVQPQIRRDSQIRVTSVSLVGEAVIDIVAGSADAPVLAEGDTLRPVQGLSREELMQRAARLREQLEPVLADARNLAPLAEARLADTRRAFAGMDEAMIEVRRIQGDLQANPGLALIRDPAFQRSLDAARSHAAELPATFEALQQRLGTAGEVGQAVQRLRSRADTLMVELEVAAALLDESAGTLGRFRNDAALQRAVEAARASLDSLIAEVQRNPLRFVF